MQPEYINILSIVITAIFTGSGAYLITLKSTRKKAEAEAMKEIVGVYQDTVKDLRKDKEFLNAEKEELIQANEEWKKKYSAISQIVEQNTRDIEELKRKYNKERCIRFDCKERIP